VTNATYPGPVSTPPDRPSVFSPSTLAPVEVDLRRVFWVGIAVWAGALTVAGVLTLTGDLTGRAVAICITGLLLGGAALQWEHRRARHAARLAESTGGPGTAG